MKLAELRAQRDRMKADMRTLADTPEADWTAEKEAQFTTMKAEYAALEQRIARQEWLDEQDRRAVGQPLGDKHWDTQLEQFSVRKAIASQVPGLDVDAGLEREVSRELAKRTGIAPQGMLVPNRVFQRRVVTSDLPAAGPGGHLIETTLLAGQYIDLLRARIVVARLGARILNDLVGDVDIPALTASAAAQWVAENSPITATDVEFDPVSLRPKHIGKITEYSRNLLLQSTPDIEDLLRSDFAQSIATAIDAAALNGGGANQPVGILPRITPVSAATGLTWAMVLNAISTVETANANVDRAAFVMHPEVKEAAMGTPKVTGTDSVMLMEAPGSLAGYPAQATSGCPAGVLIFGDFSEVMIGYWSVFDFLVNPYAEVPYSKGNVQVRGMATLDLSVRHAASFAAINAIPALP